MSGHSRRTSTSDSPPLGASGAAGAAADSADAAPEVAAGAWSGAGPPVAAGACCSAGGAGSGSGVVGQPYDQCLGLYSYTKLDSSGVMLPCVAMVYPIHVKSLSDHFPEHDQRKRKWFSPKKAARKVDEPELARIIRDFDARGLG